VKRLILAVAGTIAGLIALRQIDEAKRICRTCPVQDQCLAWALDNGVASGV
jgi:Transcription factor WhiB